MAPVLVKPEPRPEVERLALEGSERDRARRIDAGTGAIVDVLSLLYTIDLVLNRVRKENKVGGLLIWKLSTPYPVW